jgi:anti-sigma factor RsiW
MEKRLLTCREMIDFLARYLDGDLPDETRADFERHLSLCPPCVDYLASYRATIVVGKQACAPDADLPESVPAELVEAILAARRS